VSDTPADLPPDLAALVRGTADAVDGLDDETDVFVYALADFFERHDDVRAAATVRVDDADDAMTLGAAARLADVPRVEVAALLRDHDVAPRTGVAPTAAERRTAAEAAREAFEDADDA